MPSCEQEAWDVCMDTESLKMNSEHVDTLEQELDSASFFLLSLINKSGLLVNMFIAVDAEGTGHGGQTALYFRWWYAAWYSKEPINAHQALKQAS